MTDEVCFGVHMEQVKVQVMVRKILAVSDDLKQDRDA
jgi:hypothetical protein